jgi:hypothetical protein
MVVSLSALCVGRALPPEGSGTDLYPPPRLPVTHILYVFFHINRDKKKY